MNARKTGERLERPLDTVEQIFHAYDAAGSYAPVQVATLRGRMTAPLLRSALEQLESRHAALRLRISEGTRGPRWVLPPHPSPPALRIAPPDESPALLCEEELHRPFDVEAEPLVRWVFQPGEGPDGPHRILLAIHHALADGRSAAVVLDAAIQACAELLRGEPITSQVCRGLPLDDVIRRPRASAWLRHRVARLRSRAVGIRGDGPPELPPAIGARERRSRVSVAALPPDLLADLVHRARKERSTVTGALAAAMAEVLCPTGGDGLTVSIAMSLRPYVHPPVPESQVGCFVSSTPVTIVRGTRRAFWSLARFGSRSVASALSSGETLAGISASRGRIGKLGGMIQRQAQDPRGLGQPSGVSLSNWGRLPCRQHDVVRMEEWWSATANHAVGSRLHLSCGAVDGKLSMSLVHVEPQVSGDEAAAIIAGIRSSLVRAAAG